MSVQVRHGCANTESEDAMNLPALKKKVGYALAGIVVLVVGYYVVIPGFGMIYGFATNSYSEGHRDLYVCKVTRKGNIKVWELEGYSYGQGTYVDSKGVPRGWTANIESEELVKKLDGCRGDEMVRVRYRERYVRGWDTSPYLITSAEKLDEILPKKK